MSSTLSAANSGLDAPGLAFDEAEPISDDELLEFLEADADPVAADPEFRARLREQLWEMVRDGVTALPKDH